MEFRNNARLTGGEDHRHEALAAMIDAGLLDAGLRLRDADAAAQDFRGESWPTQCRRILGWQGVAHRHLSDGEAVDLAQRNVGHGTVDLANFVLNKLTRAVGVGFANAPTIWPKLARPIPLRDFKATPVETLDGPVTLRKIPQNAEAKAPAIAARAETLTAAAYGENIYISREARLNGDMDNAVRLAEGFGKAGAATIDDVLIDLLVSNAAAGPTLATDSVALFHSTHSNLAGSGAAPSVATLNTARAALRKQQDQNSQRRMNIPARVLLCPAALETTCRVLAASEAAPNGADVLEVVTAARLDDTSATGWYLFADAVQFDTLAVGYVGEGAGPEISLAPLKAPEFASDAWAVAARIDFGVCALDYRGVYRNPGA